MSNCKICFNKIDTPGINNFRKDVCICPKCYSEFKPKFKNEKINGIKALVLFDYDETIRKYLFQLKGCGDYELAPIFINRFVFELKIRYRNYVIVPFPSNKEDDENRGFNHVKEIFRQMNLAYADIIQKKTIFKQSDLSKEERKKISSKLIYGELDKIKGKKVLIVDDVMTTGSSILAAIDIVKKGRPKRIKILLLARKRENNEKESSMIKLKNIICRIKGKI